MEVIRQETNLDTLSLLQVKPGQVFTWGFGVGLYLVTNSEYVVNIHTGGVLKETDNTFIGRKVRLVKGAFHVQE